MAARRRAREGAARDDFDEAVDIDEDFQRLVRRDDAAKGLHALLAEEALKPADLRRVKAEYEAEGKWSWRRSGQSERVHRLVARADAAAGFRLGGFDFHAAPRARARGVCEWRDRDADGNVWWCNNAALVHGRTGREYSRCPYHLTACAAAHPGGP